MTRIYFVRHAQPDHSFKEDMTRPLTEEGRQDAEKVYETLKNIHLDRAVSSPYQRSVDTISGCAGRKQLPIHMDVRFREREKGSDGNESGMYQNRWNDFEYHEDGGESLGMVQRRNVEALFEILDRHPDESILFGTHGTALSTILNYYDPEFKCDDFLRMIDFMPYIIRLDFKGRECVGKEELLIVEKEFRGTDRADKRR